MQALALALLLLGTVNPQLRSLDLIASVWAIGVSLSIVVLLHVGHGLVVSSRQHTSALSRLQRRVDGDRKQIAALIAAATSNEERHVEFQLEVLRQLDSRLLSILEEVHGDTLLDGE